MTYFFHTHVHSEFSCLDGMADISRMVEKVASLKQPALALTDHGNMSGAFQLYKACKENNVLPFIGLEAYVVLNVIANKFPNEYQFCKEMINDIAYSRIYLGLHFATDNDFAKFVGQVILKHPNFTKKYEI